MVAGCDPRAQYCLGVLNRRYLASSSVDGCAISACVSNPCAEHVESKLEVKARDYDGIRDCPISYHDASGSELTTGQRGLGPRPW
ncbi:hypothetical protein CBOM_08011 [Ceraceosorus bombacis]|uniref:Uncharacterized protein n=1 Tax=Ceraceosorus bombacis TaxID=401625 RepID=A0A0P1BIZ3_9BASI|nr:hypothetical protein CBOM_08011 [Ceraceosorus bombacis]